MNRDDLKKHMSAIDDLILDIRKDLQWIRDEDNYFIVEQSLKRLNEAYSELEEIYPESLPE